MRFIYSDHSSKLELIPNLSSGYVKNGTSITCKAIDGYPNPKVTWVWISGPEYSERYFSINGNKSVLNIDKDAPLGSKWEFECISRNTIPNSLNKGKVEMVSFIIGGNLCVEIFFSF